MKKVEFPEPYKHIHPPVQEISELDNKQLSIGQRAADWIYKNVGSWRFIAIQSVLIALWIILNANAYIHSWDPYPFIFMNLIFSIQAAYTASIIMISQNRQDALKAHNDYLINLKVEEESKAILEHLSAQNKALAEIYQGQIDLRKEILRLSSE